MTDARVPGAACGGKPLPRPPQITNYYLRCVPQPAAGPRGTLVHQVGEMRLAPGRKWMPFTAEQSISAQRTEFVWRARFKLAPLVGGMVEDAYEHGRGRLDARIWGALPVAHARGPEVDRGEAQRYLAELVWCPAALVHNPEIRFRVISDQTVRVWVHDENTYVDLLFDPAGDIVGARTSTRSRGNTVEPWEGRFSDFAEFDGIRAPSKGEVWWETPASRFVYWRGEVTSLRRADCR